MTMMKKHDNITVPGAVVAKQLKFKRMTEMELATEMGVSRNHVQKLINGEIRITDGMASKLEKALDLPKEFWLTVEEAYRARLAEEE